MPYTGCTEDSGGVSGGVSLAVASFLLARFDRFTTIATTSPQQISATIEPTMAPITAPDGEGASSLLANSSSLGNDSVSCVAFGNDGSFVAIGANVIADEIDDITDDNEGDDEGDCENGVVLVAITIAEDDEATLPAVIVTD